MLRFVFFPHPRRCGSLLLLGFVLIVGCVHNRPDPPAVPIGPSLVEVDSAYTFKSWAVGSESGQAYIRLDWGDGDTSSWSGPADTVEDAHTWSQDGVFFVRAQAHDDRDRPSQWSNACSVTAVKPPYPYKLTDSITIIDAPLVDAQVSPDGGFVYVTNDWSGALSVVRSSDLQLIAQIPFNGGWGSLGQVVCSPDGKHAYATWYHYEGVAVVRTRDQVVVDSLMLGAEATGLAISPDGQRLYVAVHADSDFIIVVRLPDNVIEDTIFTPGIWSYTTSMKVAPYDARLFTGSLETGDICAINLSDNTIEWRAPVRGTSTAPGAIALHPTGGPLYVVGDDLSVLESGTGSPVTSIPISSFMWSAEVSPDGSFLYVACGDGEHNGAVAVVRTSDNEVVRIIAMPDDVYDVAPAPDGQRLYVAGANGKLYVLRR